MRRLVVASALLATLLFGSSVGFVTPATAADITDRQRATQAVTFMLAAQGADGSLDASIAETADLIIAAADLGFDPATLKACSSVGALDFLAAASDKAATDAAKTGKAILAVRAAGLDAAAFHGRNLLARLTATFHAATGAYGDGSTFAQAFAILALHASSAPVPAEAVAHLRSLQDTDGSWNFKAAKDATAGDTNSTAIALIALSAGGDHATEAKAFAYLHTQQLADGGFPYQNASTFGPPASDPDSDSLVIQALIATGQSPAATAWSKGSKNALTHLRATQAASGGFVFPGSPKADAFTTSQVVPALAGVPYGRPAEIVAGAAPPRPGCAPVPAATSPAAHVTAPPTETAVGGDDDRALPFLPIGLVAAFSGLLALAARRRLPSVRG